MVGPACRAGPECGDRLEVKVPLGKRDLPSERHEVLWYARSYGLTSTTLLISLRLLLSSNVRTAK